MALHRLSMNVNNIDKRRSAVDVLEHIGSGGVFIDPDVSDRRPNDHIVVADLTRPAMKTR